MICDDVENAAEVFFTGGGYVTYETTPVHHKLTTSSSLVCLEPSGCVNVDKLHQERGHRENDVSGT